MQSIRQYRRIRTALRQDFDRTKQHVVTDKPSSLAGTLENPRSGIDLHPSKQQSQGESEARHSTDREIARRLVHVQERDDTIESDPEHFVVTFAGDDPFKPQNWSKAKKWATTAMVGAAGFLASGAAAFDSEVVRQAMEEYKVSADIALLATVLYMITFGVGSLFSGPFSEMFGRNPVYITSLLVFMLSTSGSARAPNIQTWLVCRAFMGLFGSPPAVTFGGSMSDMWSPLQRVYIFPILAALTFFGSFLAPLVADYIATSPHVRWHFVEWFALILAGTIWMLILFLVDETYAPVLLTWKAGHLRSITGDERYRSPVEMKGMSLTRSLLHNVQRPWVLLFRETIVALFSIYLVIIYIILFGTLVAWSFIFGRAGAGRPNLAIYYLSQREVGLCYIPMNVGFALALLPGYPLYRRFKTILKRGGNISRVQPEEHLWYAMLGAPLLPASLFWLAFTSRPHIPIISPLLASTLFGFSSLCIFISCYQYIIETYETYAASALVGMTVTRYVASAPILLASQRMYAVLGVQNSLVVWACASVPMAVVPFWLYWRGGEIRKKSGRATNFGV